ncbi:MoaD/ThiS family protein [Paenarthrobacter sp.]|uniref:MoaD/ThiS family protein n=1 Tax=Paenarthrobacter sp. TaxID=1931993 RepID=UPI00281143C0|nr:MoaD/ThiS family protein [Paenarthrobacter sp.]
MLVRYFAAARAAAGVEEELHVLPEGTSLEALLEAALAVERPLPPEGTPPLARIVARSSFLRNEVAVRDRAAPLGSDDVIDVLPPFAGG